MWQEERQLALTAIWQSVAIADDLTLGITGFAGVRSKLTFFANGRLHGPSTLLFGARTGQGRFGSLEQLETDGISHRLIPASLGCM